MRAKGIIETNYSELPQIVHEKQMKRIEKIKMKVAEYSYYEDDTHRSADRVYHNDDDNMSFSHKKGVDRVRQLK
jgi:hypothetical protein